MLSTRVKSLLLWRGIWVLGVAAQAGCSSAALPEQHGATGGTGAGVIGTAGSGAGGAVSSAGGSGAGGAGGSGAGGSGGIVNAGPPVKAVSAGGYHTCALLTDGTVRCWGYGQGGVLGNGTQANQTAPTPVVGLSGAERIFAAYTDSCAQLGDGTMLCWGFNKNGQLGDGTTTEHDLPTATLGPVLLHGGVSLGQYHSCGVWPDGSASCWGGNYAGQVGDGTKVDRDTPTAVGLTNVKQVVAGDIQSCAVLLDGTVDCWGYNGFGTLGDGTTTDHLTPAPVPGLLGVAQVGLGENIACALMNDATVQCWGANNYGQLGSGANTNVNAARPQAVPGLAQVSQLSVGDNFACVLIAGGTVRCWGYNAYGQLGDGTRDSRSSATPVPQLTDVVQISSGTTHACAVTSGGTLLCWGDELAFVGGGPNANRLSPTVIAF